jgi:hypothetical protein
MNPKMNSLRSKSLLHEINCRRKADVNENAPLFIFWHALGPMQLEFDTVECPEIKLHTLAPRQAPLPSRIVLYSDVLEQALEIEK